MIKLYKGDCFDTKIDLPGNAVIITDPPFNMGYHYNGYKDKMPEPEYYRRLSELFCDKPLVCVMFPEMLHKLSVSMGRCPERVVSWVYNSNTAKQHRDIAFYGIAPDFRKVRQPYKNPNDKRIAERIAKGIVGGRLYDWWNVNQVKNVSKSGNTHPCVMPVEVMENIIGILPDDITVFDPFMGSGTTGVAALNKERDFIGVELIDEYYNIAEKRIKAAEGIYDEQL